MARITVLDPTAAPPDVDPDPGPAGNRIGDDGVRTFAELDDFATDVDIAVIGLGN